MKRNVFKKFNDFIKYNESISYRKPITLDDLVEYKRPEIQYFGVSVSEIKYNFWILEDYKYDITACRSTFEDENSIIRSNIKIDEKLSPCLYICISSTPQSKDNGELINDIKGVIKKIRSVCKFKSKIDLNKTYIIHPETLEDEIVLNENALEHEDPFSLITTDGSEFVYDINGEEVRSNEIMICMTSDTTIEITGEDFYHYYNLTGMSHTDQYKNIWTRFSFEKIASDMFDYPSFFEDYYQPEEYDIPDLGYSLKNIIESTIPNISKETRKKLIETILDQLDFDEINERIETEFKDNDDIINNISDDDLINVMNEFNYDLDIVSSIRNNHDSMLYDKFLEKAEEFIVDKVCDNLGDLYYLLEEKKENYYTDRYLYFLVDPSVIVYGYSKSGDDVVSYEDWGYGLTDLDVDDMISDYLYDFDKIKTERFDDSNIYLYGKNEYDLLVKRAIEEL
jgi:hypothetical protein